MIEPINLRDASYVTASLNARDLAEASCQYARLDTAALAANLCATPYGYLARYHGTPAMVFGAHHMTATTVSAWALGTRASWRVVPRVSRFCLGPLARQLRADGYRWAEARGCRDNGPAVRWLQTTMGARIAAQLRGYGTGGECFLLFRRWI